MQVGTLRRYPRASEEIHICVDDDIFTTNLNLDSIAEDPIEPPLLAFVPQPQVQPKMTVESEIMSEAIKCRDSQGNNIFDTQC